MTMRRAIPLVLALAACQPAGVAQPSPVAPTATPAPSVAASPATPAPSPSPSPSPTPTPVPQTATCGQKIDRSFTLANDLTCAGDALVVVANGVTIDLNGKLLKGPGMGPQTCFLFQVAATTEIYTLSLRDALPSW